MSQGMVKVDFLRGTFGYGKPVVYYGPGRNLEIPAGLARALGKIPQGAAPAASAVSGAELASKAPAGEALPEFDAEEEREAPALNPLELLVARFDISPTQAEILTDGGFGTVEAIRDAADEAILALPKIGRATLRRIRLRQDDDEGGE